MLNAPEQFGKSNGKIAAKLLGGFLSAVKALFSVRAEYLWRSERHRSRMQLLQMDDHILRDIGITRADAIEEANRDFWD